MIKFLLQVDLHVKVSDDYAHLKEKATQYPKHVSIYRGASLYARIAEPKALSEVVISSSTTSYHLNTSTDAFSVTSRGGIIYVSNVTALHKLPDTLK